MNIIGWREGDVGGVEKHPQVRFPRRHDDPI